MPVAKCLNTSIKKGILVFFTLIIFFFGFESSSFAEPEYRFLIDPEFEEMRDKLTDVYFAYPINNKYTFGNLYSFFERKSNIITEQIYYDKGLKKIIVSFAYDQKIQGKHLKQTICLAINPVKSVKSMDAIVKHSMILGIFEVNGESFDFKDAELKKYLADLLSDGH